MQDEGREHAPEHENSNGEAAASSHRNWQVQKASQPLHPQRPSLMRRRTMPSVQSVETMLLPNELFLGAFEAMGVDSGLHQAINLDFP